MHLLQGFPMPHRRAGSWQISGLFARALSLCLLLWLPHSLSMAQTAASEKKGTAIEKRVKAAFLYQFLNYVDWPAAAFAKSDVPYVIGVANADDIADELASLASGRSVNNRTVTIKKLRPGDALNDIHVLFIGRTELSRQQQLLKQAQAQPVLAVTESEGALTQGSMINFRIADDRVRFEVAPDVVEKAGLKLNSRMLAVALSVTKGTPQ
ncbi:MAG: YfiR family protein [Pseudomonadota bacterium]